MAIHYHDDDNQLKKDMTVALTIILLIIVLIVANYMLN
jgi:hypothetical protein